jgi:hypothetical protein
MSLAVSHRLEEIGEWAPEGLEHHVAFGSDGNLEVSEICDSRDQWEEFGEAADAGAG